MPTVRAGDLPYQAYQSEEPTTTVPSAYENIKSTPADFGETIGAATERLGTVIGQGANVLAEGAIARQATGEPSSAPMIRPTNIKRL
jgi:hypothetical protein